MTDMGFPEQNRTRSSDTTNPCDELVREINQKILETRLGQRVHSITHQSYSLLDKVGQQDLWQLAVISIIESKLKPTTSRTFLSSERHPRQQDLGQVSNTWS